MRITLAVVAAAICMMACASRTDITGADLSAMIVEAPDMAKVRPTDDATSPDDALTPPATGDIGVEDMACDTACRSVICMALSPCEGCPAFNANPFAILSYVCP